jgi:rare lipoprotein A (peptidoglycan hydrolase)
MARKCSSCGNNGHNSRTCSGHGAGGVRLFGVQLHVGSSPVAMKKCFSMECLSSSASAAPAYYAAALAATNSASPSASSSSSLVSVEEAPEKMAHGYLSDGLMGRAAQERKKGEFHGPGFHQIFYIEQNRIEQQYSCSGSLFELSKSDSKKKTLLAFLSGYHQAFHGRRTSTGDSWRAWRSSGRATGEASPGTS